jgi:hypothetical protein
MKMYQGKHAPVVRLSKNTKAGERFIRALVDLGAKDLRTHCSDAGTHNLWLSDDWGERREATKLCGGCPVLDQCGAAGKAWGVTWGVWGGKDLSKPSGAPKIKDKPMKDEDQDGIARSA